MKSATETSMNPIDIGYDVDGGEALCDPAEMLARVRSGDPNVLDTVSRCYGRRLLAVGRRRCAEQAEDAVQDALVAAGGHLSEVRSAESLEGWLVRLVTNACHHMRRGRKNDAALHRPVEDTDLDLRSVSSVEAPDEAASRGEWALAIGEALLELSPEDRMIVLLSDADDWTGPEIARELDLTPNAVRSRLKRVRRRLRERLEPVWRELGTDLELG